MNADGPSDVRVGVIGIGRWGRRLIDAFARAATVTTCANRGDEAAVQWLATHHPTVHHTTDTETLLSDPAIDVVVIATPIETHEGLAIRALESGKHVFVEKPLATAEGACDRVIAAASRSGRRLGVGYVFLYDDALAELRSRTRDDPITRLQLVWHKFGTFEEPLVWNLLTHEVAIALWLCGNRPDKLRVEEASGHRTELDRLHATLSFAGGQRVSIEVDRTMPATRKTVEAESASGLHYRWSDGVLRVRSNERSWQVAHSASRKPLDAEVRAFLDAVSTGSELRSDGPFARLVTAVVSEFAPGARPRTSRSKADPRPGV